MQQSLIQLAKAAPRVKAPRPTSRAPRLSLEHFIQRQRVLSLWRTIVRSIYKTPKDRRPELLAYAKGEFARHKHVTDLSQIRYLISTGKTEFDQPRDDVYGPYDSSYLQPSAPLTHTSSPIVTGTSVLGAKFKDGVVIAADNLASYGSLARFTDVKRIRTFPPNTAIGFGGDVSDMQYLDRLLSSLDIRENYLASAEHRLNAKNLHTYLSKVLYKRRSNFDPLWNQILVAGLDEEGKPFLASADLLGTTFSAPTLATGFGAHLAQPLLRKLAPKDEESVPEITREQAVQGVRECMKVLYYRDARSMDKYSIAVVTKDGVELSEDESLENQSWAFADQIRRQLQVQNSAPTSSGRTFGGQLTRLDGAAPSFVPPSTSPPPSTAGSENPQSTSQKQKQSRHPKQRQRKTSVSRSAAPDIATRIHDDIGHAAAERSFKLLFPVAPDRHHAPFHVDGQLAVATLKLLIIATKRMKNARNCDDECARLERNRNLALALHISDDHTDDHVPYSTATLTAYLQDVAWAHKQEELLRLFAADENEKRYRFKPMKPRQRAFLHSLAEDFGLDSESIDPEPHRHVILFKTPKFVAAPMKTLAQAARLRKSQLNILAPVENVAKKAVKPQFNGFLLARPRFALTEDELWPVVQKAAPNTAFSISFLSNEQGIALIPTAQETDIATTLLTRLQPSLSAEIIKAKLAGTVNLAQFDTTSVDTRVVHVQDTQTADSSGGWSQVAAKKAAPIMTARVAEPVDDK
ncbi:hypothetical protein DV738_g2598, partial [Chaetothyriales sp. CBS 135597]